MRAVSAAEAPGNAPGRGGDGLGDKALLSVRVTRCYRPETKIIKKRLRARATRKFYRIIIVPD